eukprot:3159574-Rhodomonas_salina.2
MSGSGMAGRFPQQQGVGTCTVEVDSLVAVKPVLVAIFTSNARWGRLTISFTPCTAPPHDLMTSSTCSQNYLCQHLPTHSDGVARHTVTSCLTSAVCHAPAIRSRKTSNLGGGAERRPSRGVAAKACADRTKSSEAQTEAAALVRSLCQHRTLHSTGAGKWGFTFDAAMTSCLPWILESDGGGPL